MSERQLSLRLCTDVGLEGETVRPFVRCPRKRMTIDARTCAGCMRMRSIEWNPNEGGEVRCEVGEEQHSTDPRADFAERAARTEVFEIIGSVTSCVSPDLPLERLRDLFRPGELGAVVVVDEGSRLLGLVTRAQLDAAPTVGVVREIMAQTDRLLSEHTPVSAALSAFAFGDLTPIPVVQQDGTVMGLCEVAHVLRWVAGKLGFVAP